MKESIGRNRGPVPEGYDSWEIYDTWQAMIKKLDKKNETLKSMEEAERNLAYSIIKELQTAKTVEEFLSLCAKHANQEPIKETVAIRSEEVTFPEGTYSFSVCVLPRRSVEQESEPIRYNVFFRKIE